jgi:uncharacterized protein
MQQPIPSPDHPRRRWFRGVIITIIGLVGMLASSYVIIPTIAALVLTVPPRQPIVGNPKEGAGLDYQDITFPARHDGVPISAWFIPRPDSQQVVVLVHGKGMCRTCEFDGQFLTFAAALHRRGFNTLMLDLRGHGKSGDGRFTYAIRERWDVQGAVDWLLAQGFEPGNIGVLGGSMGAASSIGATAEEPAIGALVADSSYADFRSILVQEFPRESYLPGFFLPPTLVAVRLLVGEDITRSRPVDEIGAIAPRPVLLIHARGDRLIPLSHAERLARALPESQLWISDAERHVGTYNHDPEAYIERVATFFEGNLGPATSDD